MKSVKFTSFTKPLALVFPLALLLAMGTSDTAWTESTKDKIKDAIDNTSDTLKKEVDKLGNDVNAIQDYLENYNWKGLVQNRATSGFATLSNMQLNQHGKAIVVKPGDHIDGRVHCYLDRSQCSALSFYRVVIGYKKIGGQTTICNYLGAVAGDSDEKFTLIAPAQTGLYEIRFRVVESLSEEHALRAWVDENGKEPDASTTIGVILVKS